jgi:hypothetical protein
VGARVGDRAAQGRRVGGRADGDGPDTDELADFLASLPANVRETAVLAPYGQDPGSFSVVVQNLADRLVLPLRAYPGLPHYMSSTLTGGGAGSREARSG